MKEHKRHTLKTEAPPPFSGGLRDFRERVFCASITGLLATTSTIDGESEKPIAKIVDFAFSIANLSAEQAEGRWASIS